MFPAYRQVSPLAQQYSLHTSSTRGYSMFVFFFVFGGGEGWRSRKVKFLDM